MVQTPLSFGPFELDPVRRRLSRDGRTVPLRPMAIALLCHLALARGRVVPKEELLETLWPDGTGTEANLTVTVAAVRKALGEDAQGHQLVLTVPRQGYRFVGEIAGTVPEAPEPEPTTLALLPIEIVEPDQDTPSAELEDDLPERIRSAIARHAQSLGRVELVVPEAGECRDLDLEELATRVGSDCLLLGTLEPAAASVDLQLRVVSREGDEKWLSRVSQPASEQHSLPLRAARDVIGYLDPDLGRVHREHRAGRGDESEAWQALTRARFHFGSGDGLPALHRAAVAFQQAIDAEPRLAAAHAGLTEALMVLRNAAIVDPEDAARRARDAAEAAFRLDPLLPESHLAMALVRMILDHDWNAAREHLITAQDFGPQNPWVYSRYASYLAWRRQFEAALDAIRRAQSLEPFSMRITSDVARIHHYAGQSDVALSILDSATSRKPDFATGWLIRVWIHLGLRDGDSALSALQPVRGQVEGTALWHAMVGTAHAVRGRAEPAHAALGQLRQRARAGEYVPAQFEGMIQLSLGDFDGTIEALKRSAEEHYGEFPIIEADPLWAPIRSWPGYGPLRERCFAKTLIDV